MFYFSVNKNSSVPYPNKTLSIVSYEKPTTITQRSDISTVEMNKAVTGTNRTPAIGNITHRLNNTLTQSSDSQKLSNISSGSILSVFTTSTIASSSSENSVNHETTQPTNFQSTSSTEKKENTTKVSVVKNIASSENQNRNTETEQKGTINDNIIHTGNFSYF